MLVAFYLEETRQSLSKIKLVTFTFLIRFPNLADEHVRLAYRMLPLKMDKLSIINKCYPYISEEIEKVR